MSSAVENHSVCEQLLDYAYGELDPAARAAFEAHLEGCASCRRDLESIGRVRGAIKEIPLEEPPSGAGYAQLMHAATQRKPRGQVLAFVRKTMLHPGFAAAAVFVIVGTTIATMGVRGKLVPPQAMKVSTEQAAKAPEPLASATSHAANQPAAAAGELAAAPPPPTPAPKSAPTGAKPSIADKDVADSSDPLAGLASDKSAGHVRKAGRTREGLNAGPSGDLYVKSFGGKGGDDAFSQPPPGYVRDQPAQTVVAELAKQKKSRRADSLDGLLDESSRGGGGAASARPSVSAPASGAASPPAPAPSAPAAAPREEAEAKAEAAPVQAEPMRAQAPAKLAKKQVQQGSTSSAQGDQLAAQGRCKEALVAYERAGVTGAGRLPYVRCLRAAGQLDAAEAALAQLGNDQQVAAERSAIRQHRQVRSKPSKAKAAPPSGATSSPEVPGQ